MPELRAHFPGEGRTFLHAARWVVEFCYCGSVVKNPPAKQETQVQFLGQEDPLEKEMATPSSILAWRIPWTEDPSGLWSIGSHRVGDNLVIEQHQHCSACEEWRWARLDFDQGTAGSLFSQGSCPWFHQPKNKYYLPPKKWKKLEKYKK